jgi:CRISPR-associated protein Csx17
VLRRRILDGARAGCDGLPLHSRRRVGLDVIAAFLSGQVNDQRIEDLLWALVLLDHGQRYPVQVKRPRIDNVPALPRAYALLKLLFLPRPLVCGWDADHQKHRWRLARLIQRPGGQRTLEGGIRIRPEPRVLALLNAGRIGDACRIAYERLRSSGLKPLPHPMSGRRARHNDWQDIPCAGAQRLAAALLLPISNRSINEIVHLVARQDHGPEMITR